MRGISARHRYPAMAAGTGYRGLGCALRTYDGRPFLTATSEAHGLREENRTLYRVINLVGSSIELGPMLQGIVDLATEATDCHACFIYLLEGGVLTIRAASPVYAAAVGVVQMRLDEGLTGWVARHRQPEFIRDNAMADPRMKFIPILEEERFQSMVAVPILSRAGETIGVIVLHTEAPREFTEDTLKLLVHIASLCRGAIENAQLYDQQRRRVDAPDQPVGARAGGRDGRRRRARSGARSRAGCGACWAPRSASCIASTGDGSAASAAVVRARSRPPSPRRCRRPRCCWRRSTAGASRPPARTLWPGARRRRPAGDAADLGRRAARAAVRRRAAAAAVHRRGHRDGARDRPPGRDRDQARRADRGPDQREHRQGPVRGARRRARPTFAATKAAEVRCDLSRPVPDAVRRAGRRPRAGLGRVAGRRRGARARPGGARAADRGRGRARARSARCWRSAARGPAADRGAGAGVPRARPAPAAPRSGSASCTSRRPTSARAYREALDATMIGRALLGDGGAIGYAEVGAYRYLVHIAAEDAPARPDARRRRSADRVRRASGARRCSTRSSAIWPSGAA